LLQGDDERKDRPKVRSDWRQRFRHARVILRRCVNHSLARRLACAVLVCTVIIPTPLLIAQESESELERVHRVGDLLRILDVHPGAVIADVGAGDGFFTVRIGRAVGPTGRAVAVDISESALAKVRDRVARENAPVDVVLGTVDDPHLEPGRFDAVLIHNAYHEMTAHEAILAHIRAALKPGGRLVVVEPMHDSSRGLSRERQVAEHDIESAIVERELRAAEFDVVERDDGFVKFSGVAGGFWLLVARRR
jgi:SAM-dependent methyltransferase